MATSKSLKTAVKQEVTEAKSRASEGNVQTTKAPAPSPDQPPHLADKQARSRR